MVHHFGFFIVSKRIKKAITIGLKQRANNESLHTILCRGSSYQERHVYVCHIPFSCPMSYLVEERLYRKWGGPSWRLTELDCESSRKDGTWKVPGEALTLLCSQQRLYQRILPEETYRSLAWNCKHYHTKAKVYKDAVLFSLINGFAKLSITMHSSFRIRWF